MADPILREKLSAGDFIAAPGLQDMIAAGMDRLASGDAIRQVVRP